MNRISGKFFLVVSIGLLLCPWHLLAEDTSTADLQRKPIAIANITRKTPVDFEKEILPIFKNNCLACHNKTTSKASLILETPQDILKGSESGKVIVPKRSAESMQLNVAAHHANPIVPHKNNKVPAAELAPEESALIKLWIDQGPKGEVRGT